MALKKSLETLSVLGLMFPRKGFRVLEYVVNSDSGLSDAPEGEPDLEGDLERSRFASPEKSASSSEISSCCGAGMIRSYGYSVRLVNTIKG